MNGNTSYLQAYLDLIQIHIHTCTHTTGTMALDSCDTQNSHITWYVCPAQHQVWEKKKLDFVFKTLRSANLQTKPGQNIEKYEFIK